MSRLLVTSLEALDRMFGIVFGRVGQEVNYTGRAKPALYSGLHAGGRFDIVHRRNDWGETHPTLIPVHDVDDHPMYHVGDDGAAIKDRHGNRIPMMVPLYNSFLADDIEADRVSLDAFRFIDLSALLRDQDCDAQSLIVKHAIQSGLHEQLMSCKKGNAVETPVRLLVCSDIEYARTRNKEFFLAPQDLIAYGKALVTSHETIATGDFRFKVVPEGDLGTADGQSRISVPLARELGYEGFGQLQIRLELAKNYLVTGSCLVSVLGEEVDLIISESNFKGGHTPESGKLYQYTGRLGVMANAQDRTLRIRDNFEVQHFYDDLEWSLVHKRVDELLGAHRDPMRYLELIGDTEEKDEDFTVTNAVLKAVAFGDGEDAAYVARMLMKHPWIADKVYNFILSKYADLAKTGNHYFEGSYLACLEGLPDFTAYCRDAEGYEFVFRIPMLSAGNIVKLRMLSEDDMYALLSGDSCKDAEILAAIYNRGSIFVNSRTAAKLNSDFDMDPMCRCPESDPYFHRLETVKKKWGRMALMAKAKTRVRSEWNRFGVSDAVSDFIAAPNIGSLTLLQDNILMKKDDQRSVAFCRSLGLTIEEAAELVGTLVQIAVDSHKWTTKLTPEEVRLSDKLMKYFTGKSPFHRNIIREIRKGNTQWDITPTNHLEKLVEVVRDALKANNLDDIMESFAPGSYVGFLGIPSGPDLDILRSEVLERVKTYNRSIAAVLSSTKEGSRHRADAIAQVCEGNRMDFAYLRASMPPARFLDFVRLAWDAAHQAAARSTSGSKASFIFTAGVADLIVEALNGVYNGIGRVSSAYKVLKPGEIPAPRLRLFDGWRNYVTGDPKDLLVRAFTYEIPEAVAEVEQAMKDWAAEVTGKTVAVGLDANRRRATTCLFAGKNVVGYIRTGLVEYGVYRVTSVTHSGVQLVVTLEPIHPTDGPKTTRHQMRAVRLWQNTTGSDSKEKKALRAVKTLRTAMRLVDVEAVPGSRGVDLKVGGRIVASLMSNGINEALVLGHLNIVGVDHTPGKLSAVITVDKVATIA